MSELTGLIAISALAVAGVFVLFYISRMTNDLADQIVTGFIRDHPIPATQRWIMLYTRWVSYVGGVVGATLTIAFASVVIADHLGDDDTKRLGYLTAFMLSVAAATWLIQGTVQFIGYRSILRQAERD